MKRTLKKVERSSVLFLICFSILLISLFLFACGRGQGRSGEEGATRPPEPAAMGPAAKEPAAKEPAAMGPAPESDVQPCARLVQEYQAVRDGSPGACETDDDCVILPGGVDDCGRALDKTTAELLEPLYQTFRDRCGLTRRCAPRAAAPYCRGGRCMEGLPPGSGAIPRPPRPR